MDENGMGNSRTDRKTGNEKPTPYFRQERERNQLRNFSDRIHGSRIQAGKIPGSIPVFCTPMIIITSHKKY